MLRMATALSLSPHGLPSSSPYSKSTTKQVSSAPSLPERLLTIFSQHSHASPTIRHLMPSLPTGRLPLHLSASLLADNPLLPLLAPLPLDLGNMAHLCRVRLFPRDGNGSPDRLPRYRVAHFRLDRNRRILCLFMPSCGVHRLP